MLVLAVPGLVIALSFTYRHRALPAGTLLPDDPSCWSLAYAIMFFPTGRGLGARRRGPLAGGARGGGRLARRAAALGLLAGDPAR